MEASPALAHLIREAQRRFGDRAAAIGPDDDVFEALDIDSMGALDLLSVLEDHFDVEIPDHELRTARTFRQLATLVDRRR
ncbi:MAG: acyl carrier protein [Myxococcota bacterium]